MDSDARGLASEPGPRWGSTDPPSLSRPRSRGILLNALDRSQLHVIGYSGRRWETLGTLAEITARTPTAEAPEPSAGGGAASIGPEPSPEAPG